MIKAINVNKQKSKASIEEQKEKNDKLEWKRTEGGKVFNVVLNVESDLLPKSIIIKA